MPGPSCSTCARPDLADVHRVVDAGAKSGGGVSAAARRFKIPKATLLLHLKHREATPIATAKQPPDPPAPPVSADALQVVEPVAVEPDLPLGDLDGRIAQLARTADRLRAAAEAKGSPLRERGTALGEARRTVESMAELAEKRDRGREVEILKSPEWAAARAAIVAELQVVPGGLESLVRAEARLG